MKTERGKSTAIAIGFLQHLSGKACDDALIGDLLERMAEGRTDGWLWRQVLVALVIGVGKELRGYSQEIGSVVIGTGIVLGCGGAQWRSLWVGFLWGWAAEHHLRWASYVRAAFAIEETYGAALALFGLLVIFTCRRTNAWNSIVRAIPTSAVIFSQAQLAFLLIADPASSFWDVHHLLILGFNAGTLFVALLIPIWTSRRGEGAWI